LESSPYQNKTSNEEEDYSRVLLSKRWNQANGDVFFYALYFLHLGDFHRVIHNPGAHNTILSTDAIDELESRADFLGLLRLVDLCKARLWYAFVVDDMIAYSESNKHFRFKFKTAVEFLFSFDASFCVDC